MSAQSIPAQVAKRLRRLLLLCGVAALAIPGVAGAATVQYSLSDLLPGGNTAGGFTIGDKRYSAFTFASSGSSPLSPSDVNVRVTSSDATPGVAGDDRYSIQFTFGMDAFPGERTDLVLCYRVDVLDPAMTINRVGLRFNGSVPSQGPGNAAASVIETVQSTDGSDVAPGAPVDDTLVLDVFNDGPGRLEDDNSDFVTVNPARSLLFCKDILVSSQPDGGYAAISIVDNIVDQVPEPGMLGLAAFAGGGLLLRRRR
jgi:hypothetical protein